LIDVRAGESKNLEVSLVLQERSITQGLGSFPDTGRLTTTPVNTGPPRVFGVDGGARTRRGLAFFLPNSTSGRADAGRETARPGWEESGASPFPLAATRSLTRSTPSHGRSIGHGSVTGRATRPAFRWPSTPGSPRAVGRPRAQGSAVGYHASRRARRLARVRLEPALPDVSHHRKTIIRPGLRHEPA